MHMLSFRSGLANLALLQSNAASIGVATAGRSR